MRRARLAVFFSLLVPRAAFAQETPPTVDLEKDTKAPELFPAPPPEAPPPEPYKKSVVLDTTIGANFFLGEFGRVAPPGPLFRMQLGYEVFKFLMVLGEGELSFTDTSNAQDPPRVRAFAIFGFGAGARFTLHVTERIGVYLQPTLGALKADVPNSNQQTNGTIGGGGLGIIGFRNAESFGLYTGIRAGLEWYQLDRHFGLGLTFAFRSAAGFEKAVGSDAPLLADVGASLRYAF